MRSCARRKFGWLAQARTRAVPERKACFCKPLPLMSLGFKLRCAVRQSASDALVSVTSRGHSLPFENGRECPRLPAVSTRLDDPDNLGWSFRPQQSWKRSSHGRAGEATGGSLQDHRGESAATLSSACQSPHPISTILGTNSTRSFYVIRQCSGSIPHRDSGPLPQGRPPALPSEQRRCLRVVPNLGRGDRAAVPRT